MLVAALLLGSVTIADPPIAADLLAGPTVAVEMAPASLVVRDFDGRLVPLEEEPDLAAIRLLALDAARQAKVDAIVLDRQRQFDRIALANYATVAEIGALLASGPARDPARLGELLRRFSLELLPYERRGGLLEECGELLDGEQRARATALVAAYRDALAAARAAVSPETSRFALATRLRFEEIGRLVRDAIRRFAASAEAELERFRAELDLAPEQVETVRAAFGPLAVARAEGIREGKALRDEATRAYLEVYRILDRGQRAKLAALRFRDALERARSR